MKKKLSILSAALVVCLFAVQTIPIFATNGYSEGHVFYNQDFKNTVHSIEDAGLTLDPKNNAKYRCFINNNGYLDARSMDGDAPLGYNRFILPDVVPADISTFTVEATFRFTNPECYNHGGMIFGFGYGSDKPQDCNIRYNNDGKFDKFGDKALSKVSSQLLASKNGPSKWITAKVSIENYQISQAIVIVEGNEPITLEALEPKTTVNPGRLFIMQGYTDVEISSIKVVNGMNYSTYSGEYATKFYYNPVISNPFEYIGFSIRTVDPQGLRVKYEISQETLNASKEVDGYEVIEYGAILTQEKSFGDETLFLDSDFGELNNTGKVILLQNGKYHGNIFAQTEDGMVYTAVLTNIRDENLNESYLFRAYCIVETALGDKSVIYSDVNKTSIYDIAKQVLSDTEHGLNEEQLAYVEGIINKVES